MGTKSRVIVQVHVPWFPERNVISLAVEEGIIADRLLAVDGEVEEPAK